MRLVTRPKAVQEDVKIFMAGCTPPMDGLLAATVGVATAAAVVVGNPLAPLLMRGERREPSSGTWMTVAGRKTLTEFEVEFDAPLELGTKLYGPFELDGLRLFGILPLAEQDGVYTCMCDHVEGELEIV